MIEGQAWGLEVSVYLHLNPVVTVEMGLGKRRRKLEQKGWSPPPAAAEVERRLKQIREYPWSSYRAYAGYGGGAKWLSAAPLLQRCAPPAAKDRAGAYRALVEARLKQGQEESPWQQVRWGLVLGSERFARKVRGRLRISRESAGRGGLRERRSRADLIALVERLKGERWEAFRERHGDWGRDLVLWAGRHYGGQTLRDLGVWAGGLDYTAVSNAIVRMESRAKTDRPLRRAMAHLRRQCESD